ncbi:MAG: ChaN family lipoprotein [Calothrix sp. C42_A2020_038]|nr:ChaN family lipoprotein [Calothrix sp. C42_A2020_038]
MQKNLTLNLMRAFILSLGCFLLCAPTVVALPQTPDCESRFSLSKCVSSVAQIVPEMVGAKVVYLGETHDSAQDHENQLKIIQELHKRNKKIAIGMEMFQRPFQNVINQYLAGKISEEELVKQTEYEKRWGFDWELYAPIVRFAKANNLPVLALNTPTEITRKVSRQGLESLTPSERKLIPPFSEIRTSPEAYRKMVLAAFTAHQTGGHGNSSSAERFFLAQVLWDETMAESIASFIKSNPDYQMVVLAGQGHIVYNYGIPSRVERRLKGKPITQRSVLLSPPEDTDLPKNKKIADFIWHRVRENH